MSKEGKATYYRLTMVRACSKGMSQTACPVPRGEVEEGVSAVCLGLVGGGLGSGGMEKACRYVGRRNHAVKCQELGGESDGRLKVAEGPVGVH